MIAHDEHQQVSRLLSILTGIAAGIGFCIKPHFFIPLIFLQCYYRKIYSELIAIYMIALLYLLLCLIMHPTYFTQIIPLVFHYYYVQFDVSEALQNKFIITIFFIIFCYAISLSFIKSNSLEKNLLLVIFGFLVSYFIQKTPWDYHLYPAVAFTCLLSFQLAYRYVFLAKKYYDINQPMTIFYVSFLIPISFFLVSNPIKYIYKKNTYEFSYLKQERMLVAYLTKTPNKSIYFLTTLPNAYPATDYLHFKDDQLVQLFWFLPGFIIKKNVLQNDKKASHLIDNIINDIIRKNPDIILASKFSDNKYLISDSIAFFSEYPLFKQFIQHYQANERLGNNVIIYTKS